MNTTTNTAANTTAPRYNRVAIFKRAWQIVKWTCKSFASALRRAWGEAINAALNAAKGIIVNTQTIIEHATAVCNSKFNAKFWGTKIENRIYINNPTQTSEDRGLSAYVDLGFIPRATTFTNTMQGISYKVVVTYTDGTTTDKTAAIAEKLQAQLLGAY